MVAIYEHSVGLGGNMLLNIAPPPNSSLPTSAVKTYRDLGLYIRSCYGIGDKPAAGALASTVDGCFGENCSSITLNLEAPAVMDRILLKEELRGGQRVLAFHIEVDGLSVWNGTAIGRSLIAKFKKNVTGSAVTLVVDSSLASPEFRLIAVPNPSACAISTVGRGCTLIKGVLYDGIVVRSLQAGPDDCCSACHSIVECAFFTVVGTSNCTLLSTQQGSEPESNAVSGSPRR